jgi:hypothetical protein|tara:strand:- start:2658 stop:3086 length:429 start_codon:yes stop_codon:yes gene_type:complete
MSNVIEKIFDNTKDGVPNYSLDLIDGTRLYCRGTVLNPMPKSGDAINFTVINTKTSANGNPYTNVKDIEVVADHTQDDVGSPTNPTPPPARPMVSKDVTQRRDIFVTGIVGRAMGSGHFSVDDISDLTKNAVRSFNENLERL